MNVVQNKIIACVLLMAALPIVLSTGTDCSIKKHEGGGTSIDCSGRNLTQFPSVTGENVTELSVAFNSIAELREDALSHLTSLTRVNLAHNLLTEIDLHAFCGLSSLQSVDLSYNRLAVLHDDAAFHNLSSLVSLDLGNNQLQALANNTFGHLQRLTWLSLASNRLNSLEAGALLGLISLTHLDLSHNDLEISSSSSLPPGIFGPLGQLQDLHIEYNSRLGSYPDHVFSDLVSLRRLTIDTFSDMYFGKEFSALRHIETLDLTQNCRVNFIYNNSLEGFQNSTLSELLFKDCDVMGFELCAFCNLPALKRLQFIGGDTSSVRILEALYGLQYQTMSEISLHRVGSHSPVANVLGPRVARYLRNICVSTFKMVDCNVERLMRSALTNRNFRFSTCVEHIDLSANSLRGDFSAFWGLLTSCPRLRVLSLNDQQTFSFARAKCLLNQNYQCKTHHLMNDPRKGASVTVTVPSPQNLTYLNVSSVFPHLNPMPSNITFPTATQLKTLDLSYLGLATCRATIYGLENLETLSLEGNICTNFTDTAFDMLPNLRTLSLSSIVLDQEYVSTRARRVFQNLVKLEILDLSLNNLIHVDSDMLRAQARLRELDLSGNRLQSVSVGLEHHKDLRKLDLTHNMLTTVTPSERRALDTLAGRHDLRLRLRGNPLACSCFNLDLVQWLWHTSVSLDGEGHPANYTCTTDSGEVTSTEEVMANWLKHWRGCVGGQIFSFALSAFLVQILGLIITFFVVRAWPQLYYAWRAIRNLHLPRRRSFRKDAYVVYADVDDDVDLACLTLRQCLEEQYDVRLLLRNRDEIGGNVAENIVQYIDDSWKVVLLITRAFCEGDWACGFATTQAQRSITASMPDRVILIFFEDPGQLPLMEPLEMLLRMVPTENILYIRPGTPAQHGMWKILADMILYEPKKR